MLIVYLLALLPTTANAEVARGVVFHDQNGDGTRQTSESGLPDVCVSNGVDVVTTDAAGKYEIEVDDDTIVFVIKPRDWQVPLDEERLPQFYYIHKPEGSPDDLFAFAGVEPTGPLPESIDFPLSPSKEAEEFSVVLMGDPQPYNRQQVRYYANDVIAELVDSKAAFGISLGDIVGNRLSLFEHVNAVQGKVGVPWYNVLGNHDLNFRSPTDEHSDESFERVYGPVDFAFQWASVHFLILDNVRWNGVKTNNAGNVDEGNYVGALSDDQLTFVENYVAHVPANQRIVVCTHIPLIHPTSTVHGTPELKRLLTILSKHPHQMSFSAHTHYNRHEFVGGSNDLRVGTHNSHEPPPGHEHVAGEQHHEHDHHHHFQLHHHHNAATGSGSWYRGPKDEQGFPMTPMRDGVPNGYIVATFSGGSKYRLRYKAARMPAEFQMSIHTPESIEQSQVASTEVVANVFNGNEKSSVRMRVRGTSDWLAMTRTEREDPTYRAMYERDQADEDRPHTALPAPLPTPHIWVAKLPADTAPGVHVLEVESTDMFGQVDRGIRLIEIEPDESEDSSHVP